MKEIKFYRKLDKMAGNWKNWTLDIQMIKKLCWKQ